MDKQLQTTQFLIYKEGALEKKNSMRKIGISDFSIKPLSEELGLN